MKDKADIWKSIEKEDKLFHELGFNTMVNYEKFQLYSIIAHSTAIEGSTLSDKDAQLLFDEGITKKGNIVEYLMNIDLKNSYDFALKEAVNRTKITPDFLKQLNSLVMYNTGTTHNLITGSFDSSKGDYRLCGVTAGTGGKSYMDYKKISSNVEALCNEINKRIDNVSTLEEIYTLSFDAHFNLLTIHPWIDGNGRTSRLLMNYIQFYHVLVPTKIHKEDKGQYISTLDDSRESNTNAPIRRFMAEQHLKTLKTEIRNHIKNSNKSNNFTLLF